MSHDLSAHAIYPGYVLLQWKDKIDSQINQDVLSAAQHLRELSNPYIIDTVPTYASLGIFYDHDGVSALELLKVLSDKAIQEVSKNEWLLSRNEVVGPPNVNEVVKEVPVCYDPEFGLDLDFLSREKGLSIDDVITLHTTPVYRLYFIGFLPGFMYLGGLENLLVTPRRTTPRTTLPAGSVSIGNDQTGIYPIESPGGWHIIGRCPLKLFDIERKPPVLYEAGDQIKFKSISKAEFDHIYNESSHD